MPSRNVTVYQTSLYLGELAARHSGGTSVHTDAETNKVSMDSEAIRLCLNDVLESLHNGHTLDEVIREISDGCFESTVDFEKQFIKGEARTDATVESASELSDVNAIAIEDKEANSETSDREAFPDDADTAALFESHASDNYREANFKESAFQDSSEVESDASTNTTELNE